MGASSARFLLPLIVRVLAGIFGAGIAAVAYGIIEARLHTVRTYRIAVLPPGTEKMSIMQVSDLHLRPSTKRLIKFMKSLSGTEHDIVFATGDLLGGPEVVELCADLLDGLKARVGRYYVLGSSDYYAPKIKSYLDYFLNKRRISTKRNPTRKFTDLLDRRGWIDMTNRTIVGQFGPLTMQLTGLDDPYLHRDDRTLLKREPGMDLAVCVVHDPAPYDEAIEAGFDLIVAGHTHGGQVRLPLVGALVTNSTLPTELAKGPHRVDGGWLFVSPGLGTGRYAPFRFLSRPEASILELVPVDQA